MRAREEAYGQLKIYAYFTTCEKSWAEEPSWERGYTGVILVHVDYFTQLNSFLRKIWPSCVQGDYGIRW